MQEKREISFNNGDFVIIISENTFANYVKLRVRKISAMPFKLPSGYQPASFAYDLEMVEEDISFQKGVTIKIRHCATVTDQENGLVFMRASSTKPDDDDDYTFSIISGGNFTSEYGEITVDHFTIFIIATLALVGIPICYYGMLYAF